MAADMVTNHRDSPVLVVGSFNFASLSEYNQLGLISFAFPMFRSA
jgi:hypothetical protein